MIRLSMARAISRRSQGVACVAVLLLLAPAGVIHAQGLVQGMQRGARDGNRAAGPIGGVLGGAVGGVVGAVGGALGVPSNDRSMRGPVSGAQTKQARGKNAKGKK